MTLRNAKMENMDNVNRVEICTTLRVVLILRPSKKLEKLNK